MIRYIRVFVRALLMVPMLVSAFWSVLTASGLVMAVVSSWVAILFAENSALQRLRGRSIVVITITLLGAVILLAHMCTSWTMLSDIFGPLHMLWLRSIVLSGGVLGTLVWALRLAAHRSGVWFTVELTLISLGCGFAFLPHQHKIIMRPLWLSDLAWSIGLEPSVALGIIGAFLATVLAVLTVFDRSKRFHISILLFPLLSLLALLFIDPTEMDTPPPPQSLEQIKNNGVGGNVEKEGRNSSGGGEGDENSQNNNSGDKDKSDGSGGPPQPVAVVLLGDDYTPPDEYFYFRQEIYSAFNGVRLVPPTDPEIPYEASRGFPSGELALPQPPNDEGYYRKEIITDVAMLAPHTAPFVLESPISITPTVNPRPGQFIRTYRGVSSASTTTFQEMLPMTVGNSSWSEKELSHYTQTPDDPRYKALAEDIVAQLPEWYQDNKVAQVFAIKLFLDEQTQYTRKVRHEKAEDPTAEFLFGPTDQFTGYCVHTSHAAVFLWRALGIPARIGVGYAVSMEQQRGSAILVLGQDAHSWSEVYFEEMGWVIVDISPQNQLDQANGPPPDMDLLESLEELARANPDSKFRQSINWKELWAQYKPILQKGMIFVLCVAVFAVYIRKIRRRWWYLIHPTPQAIYVSALDRLSEHGIFRAKGETPEYFAQRIPPSFASATPIIWARSKSIYSGELQKTEIAQMQRDVESLQAEITQEISWLRRILRFLQPFSIRNSR